MPFPVLVVSSALLLSMATAETTKIELVKPDFRQKISYSWKVKAEPVSPGFGLVLDHAQISPTDWAEPSFAGWFGVGFDTQNKKTSEWFGSDGNIYGRPEREVSLHFDGREIANRFCSEKIITDNPQHFTVTLESVVGGSEVTVQVGTTLVYDRYFVPGLKPKVGKWTVGGTGLDRVMDANATIDPKKVKQDTPIRVPVFANDVNDIDHHRIKKTVDFPEFRSGVGRVIGTFRLKETPKGIDRWDRLGQIFMTTGKGERFEVLRYITPYRKGWEWKVDLTDYLPLFKGRTEFELVCETWGEGWLVDLDLDFVPGKTEWTPIRVVNLWTGVAELGNPDKPVTDFFKPMTEKIDRFAQKVKSKIIVTGHGQLPNTDNAAEFLPLWREFRVNEQLFTNTLWKNDVYLNPCRPQGGTWKFDRAGWAPGDVVSPWDLDLTDYVKPGEDAKFQYAVQPYENKERGHGNPANHVVQAQLIYYARNKVR